MLRLIKNIFLLTVPSIILILIFFEVIVFRYLIPAASLPYIYFDAKDQILKYDQRIENKGVYTTGLFAQQRAWWHINNDGWNSAIDYSLNHKDKPLIAIIGDSYIEAFQVDPQKSIVGIIREKMKDKYEVYGFGLSGAPLSQYMHMSRYAKKHFNPDVLVINVVHNDFDESLCAVKNAEGMLCLDCNKSDVEESPVMPYFPSKLKRLIRKSALVRYCMLNLNVLGRIERYEFNQKNYNANIDVDAVNRQRQHINLAVDYMLEKIKDEYKGKKIIFEIDAPRNDIYCDTLAESSVIWMNQLLADKCKKHNLDFLDLTAAFANDYKVHHKKFDVPDGHWNAYGHKIAATALFKKLREIGL